MYDNTYTLNIPHHRSQEDSNNYEWIQKKFEDAFWNRTDDEIEMDDNEF